MSQALRIGFITGVIVATLFIIESTVVMPMGLLLTVHYGGTLVLIAGVYVAVRRTRDLEMNGIISVKDGLKAGMKAGVVVAVFFVATFFIRINYITDIQEFLNQEHPVTHRKLGETPSLLIHANVGTLIRESFHFAIPTMMVGFFAAIASGFLLRRGTGMLNEN
jgi:hypothetical protein